MADPALLLVGHGSRVPEAAAEMAALIALLRARVDAPVSHGWIEIAEPSAIDAARDLASREGVSAVTLVPLLTFPAFHATVDVPHVAATLREVAPGIEVRTADVLGPDDRLVRLAVDRIRSVGEVDGAVIVASGTSDAAVQHLIADLAATIGRQAGLSAATHAFASLADPGVADALDGVVQPGGRIAVFSWSLLDGRLSRGALAAAHDWSTRTSTRVVDAGRLGPDPVVADVLADRYRSAPRNV